MSISEFSRFFAFFSFCFHSHALISSNVSCTSDDLAALREFQNGLMTQTIRGTLKPGIDFWNTLDSHCCSWAGVMCETSLRGLNSSKRVVGLDLGSRKLRGRLSIALVGLGHLRILNISHNMITGAPPADLFKLQNLEVLDLSNNEFSGPFPGELYLPSILVFDVSKNYLAGTMDPSICTNSSSIQVLRLSMNSFSGNIPAGFGNCTCLEELILNSNDLYGSLPEDLFKLQKLRYLHLQDNSLSGALNEATANFSKLVELDISLNDFSGAIPNVFLSLAELYRFGADSNSFSGALPYSLSNSPTIRILNVRNNSLSGPIYLNCTVMVHLRSLTLSFNEFHGPIPDSLSFCRKLETLNLAQNPLGGEVPRSFKNLQSLSALSLTNTRLTNISAALGVLQHCKSLRLLVLTSNFNGERIPSYPNLVFKSLEALIIPNCHLSGLIPKWLSSCNKLQVLDLSSNFLSGKIPEWLSMLQFLFYINLSNNLFTGKIPISLTNMRSLIDQNEHLTPLEPGSLGIPLFKEKYQGNPMKHSDIWRFPPTMDLSHNLLTGPIWPEIGNLKNLHFMDLKWNHLSGLIPDELSRMISLEVLDLSHNNISGTIPPSLSNLSFLSKFSVAYNHMYGMVPLGGQFSTFPCSSFEGNVGLIYDYCDNHSAKVVPVEYPNLQAWSKKVTMSIIELPFWIGLGAGFLVAVIICLKSGFVLPQAPRRRRRLQNKIWAI